MKRDSVWQWSVEVPGAVSGETGTLPRAFLWIPEKCRRVRAVVLGQHNMQEEQIFESPIFRAALRKLDLALVWVTPAFAPYFRYDRGEGERFEAMMAALATESGYDELARVPVTPIGHSAMAGFPWAFAAWKPERTLAALSVSGQWPFWPDENLPKWSTNALDGVPGLKGDGEYEWADERAADGLKQRWEHPGLPLTMVAEPGGGHFDASDEKIELLALYLKKALQYRLRPDGTLRPIDPGREGWLVERWFRNKPPEHAPAPVAQYRGDSRQAFWCFDGELAHALVAFGERFRGKKVPLTGYIQDGSVVQQVNGTHQQVTLAFRPEGDGLTFTLKGTFLDSVPAGRPERWVGKRAGDPGEVPHGAPLVTVSRICGPVEQLGSNTWAIRFDKLGFNNRKRSNEVWLRSVFPGDGEFRRMVQQSVLHFPRLNAEGTTQDITFPELTGKQLRATASSGEKVRYYVLAGPAEMVGDDSLRFTPIPPRAKLPIKITVVAWQWGRSIEPKLQTATPVERVLWRRK